jgi:hypothetical protein
MRATSSAHVNLLDLIILIILGEEYKLWSEIMSTVFYKLALSLCWGPNSKDYFC